MATTIDCIYRVPTGNPQIPNIGCGRKAMPGKEYCWQHDPERNTLRKARQALREEG